MEKFKPIIINQKSIEKNEYSEIKTILNNIDYKQFFKILNEYRNKSGIKTKDSTSILSFNLNPSIEDNYVPLFNLVTNTDSVGETNTNSRTIKLNINKIKKLAFQFKKLEYQRAIELAVTTIAFHETLHHHGQLSNNDRYFTVPNEDMTSRVEQEILIEYYRRKGLGVSPDTIESVRNWYLIDTAIVSNLIYDISKYYSLPLKIVDDAFKQAYFSKDMTALNLLQDDLPDYIKKNFEYILSLDEALTLKQFVKLIWRINKSRLFNKFGNLFESK